MTIQPVQSPKNQEPDSNQNLNTEPESKKTKLSRLLPIGIVILIFLLWGANWYFALHYLPEGRQGPFGDMFGAVNSLFSGLALIGVALAIIMQLVEMKEAREQFTKQARALEDQVKLAQEAGEFQRQIGITKIRPIFVLKERRDLAEEYEYIIKNKGETVYSATVFLEEAIPTPEKALEAQLLQPDDPQSMLRLIVPKGLLQDALKKQHPTKLRIRYKLLNGFWEDQFLIIDEEKLIFVRAVELKKNDPFLPSIGATQPIFNSSIQNTNDRQIRVAITNAGAPCTNFEMVWDFSKLQLRGISQFSDDESLNPFRRFNSDSTYITNVGWTSDSPIQRFDEKSGNVEIVNTPGPTKDEVTIPFLVTYSDINETQWRISGYWTKGKFSINESSRKLIRPKK